MDYVSDRRAPTPSAAAEIAVPVRVDVIEKLHTLNSRMRRQMFQFLERQRAKTFELERALPRPKSLIYDQFQYLDFITSRFGNAFSSFLKEKKLRLVRASAEISKPSLTRLEFANRQTNLKSIISRLDFIIDHFMTNSHKKLEELSRLQDSLSYKSTLSRGFVIVRDIEERLVNSKKRAISSKNLSLEFKDGKIRAIVDSS